MHHRRAEHMARRVEPQAVIARRIGLTERQSRAELCLWRTMPHTDQVQRRRCGDVGRMACHMITMRV